jgi:hypothetical protein
MAKYAQNGLIMHLPQSRISKFSGGGLPTREGENTPLGLSPTCACGVRFAPPALNSPPTL